MNHFKLDVHTHILPKEWPLLEGVDLRIVDICPGGQSDPNGFTKRMEWSNGSLFRKVKPNCMDIEAIIAQCDQFGVDAQVLTTVPVMFNYHLNPTIGCEWTRFLNNDISATVASAPRRTVALGSLPMQCTEEACQEMKRCVVHNGLRGFQIGSHINSWKMGGGVERVMLSDRRLDPVWQTACDLEIGIFVHPWDMDWCDDKYWLQWLVGMPTEVSLAMCSTMLGGVIDRFPSLKLMFAHGGGSLPGIVGRVDWGYRCRPDLVACDSEHLPRNYLDKLYVDSICHDETALRHLVYLFGAQRVAMGSDFPFPLGEVPSVAPVSGEVLNAYPGRLVEESTWLSSDNCRRILGGTALEFLGLSEQHFDRHEAKSRTFWPRNYAANLNI